MGLTTTSALFALTPLPTTIGQATGNTSCRKNTQVWTITASGNYSAAVSASKKSKCDVQIHHKRAGATKNSSAQVTANNSAGMGPFPAIAGDTIEVECFAGRSGNKCIFQWQVNKV